MLNHWGKLRTWQNHMVAHALPYKQIVTYLGVIESLAAMPEGRFFALSDVLGVDKELSFSLSTDKYVTPLEGHFITADLDTAFDPGEGARDVYPVTSSAQVLTYEDETHISVNQYGAGRSVYLAGLPHSSQNARVLLRSILWATGNDSPDSNGGAPATWWTSNPDTDVAAWGSTFAVVNSTLKPVTTTVTGPGGISETVSLEPAAMAWFNLP